MSLATSFDASNPPPSQPRQQQQQQQHTSQLSSHDSDSQSSSSTSSPLILYRPPTVISVVRTVAINLILPFINGLMLGFGELFAHEIAFRLGWGGTRVSGYLLVKYPPTSQV